ncbi:hypothetical protein HPB48_026124 [Haemaphysalis longicornis]|uniref:Uncharacterized protein n=1 Tax=Haemaphysalis longicornis TaxID=44386 RepID=A0A9J6H8U1_HAELO|nr:hypothetical protein HPB48_026124 [Haemaphysalis longicornis]
MLVSGERRLTCDKCECTAASLKPTHEIGYTDGADGASAHSTTPLGEETAVPTASSRSSSLTQPVEQAPPRGLTVSALGSPSFHTQGTAETETENGNPDPYILYHDPAGIEDRPARIAPTWTEVVSRNRQRRLRQQQSHLVAHISSKQHGFLPNRTTPQHQSRMDKRLTHRPQLPPLPLADYKEVIRPLTDLILAQWFIQCVTNAISATAEISDATQDRITFRIRRDQNLVMVSSTDLDIAKKIQQITTYTWRASSMKSPLTLLSQATQAKV